MSGGLSISVFGRGGQLNVSPSLGRSYATHLTPITSTCPELHGPHGLLSYIDPRLDRSCLSMYSVIASAFDVLKTKDHWISYGFVHVEVQFESAAVATYSNTVQIEALFAESPYPKSARQSKGVEVR